ncbi:MAG TPA: hypothetical protein VNO43_06685 [Candidatus Eisenbacteria bacterium]|nr:hypothetical protein [Candidatus Eisenbacteria bacterium]
MIHEFDKKDLVYGERGGSLVFIPKYLAVELVNLWAALQSSRTWGELKSRIGDERYQEILMPYFENFYDELSSELDLTREEAMEQFQARRGLKDLEIGDRLPEDDDLFDIRDVLGLADGDWPEWPAQEMLNRVPDKI